MFTRVSLSRIFEEFLRIFGKILPFRVLWVIEERWKRQETSFSGGKESLSVNVVQIHENEKCICCKQNQLQRKFNVSFI